MTEFPAEPFPDRPRMIFMGTPDFAVPTLKALIAHGHDVLAVQVAAPEAAPADGLLLLVGHESENGRELLMQRADDGGGACHYFLSRSSRRRILPTGVLGSSVRNSTTRGCL